MRQEGFVMQWRQLDHMQNNLHLALISVYSSWRPTNSIKALKARLNEYKHYYLIYTHTTV